MTDKKKIIIATVTNAAYGIAGLAMGIVAPAVFAVLLMFGSGYHHYHLKSWSRKYDYLGMYGMLISIVLYMVGISFWWNIGLTVAFGALAFVLWKSNRVVVGAMIGIVLIAFLIKTGGDLASFLKIASIASIAFVFNRLGDTAHRPQMDLVHGLGWHVPTAYALFLTMHIIAVS